MNNMKHLHCVDLHAVENQIVAEWASANARRFVPRYECITEWRIGERLAALLHPARPSVGGYRIVFGDIVRNSPNIRLSLGREFDLQDKPLKAKAL